LRRCEIWNPEIGCGTGRGTPVVDTGEAVAEDEEDDDTGSE